MWRGCRFRLQRSVNKSHLGLRREEKYGSVRKLRAPLEPVPLQPVRYALANQLSVVATMRGEVVSQVHYLQFRDFSVASQSVCFTPNITAVSEAERTRQEEAAGRFVEPHSSVVNWCKVAAINTRSGKTEPLDWHTNNLLSFAMCFIWPISSVIILCLNIPLVAVYRGHCSLISLLRASVWQK